MTTATMTRSDGDVRTAGWARTVRALGIIASGLALTACAVGPDFKPPPAPAARRYTEIPAPAQTASAPGVGGATQRLMPGADIPAEWWMAFQSREIDGLVREALEHSPTLGAAQATLRQARETLRATEGGLLAPNVSGSVQGARERTTIPTPVGSSPPLIFNTLNATVGVSYNVDVFGGARRQIEASQAQVQLQNEQLEATYLTLTANVVTTALREASLRAQLQAAQSIADVQANFLDIVQKQFSVGAVSRSTVLVQQTALATTRATIPGLEKQLAQTRNQLAILIGRTPSDAELPTVTLESITLPTDLPVSLPSTLVRQRPDVRASEAQLHQASALVGVATANLYPHFDITGYYGVAGSSFSHLLNPAHVIWSLGGGLTAPIFNGGQLSAERRAAVAAYDAAWQQYRSTVLQAFQNVADTLVALENDAKTLAADAEADALARETLQMTQGQYRLGAVNYLTLLVAQQQYDQAHTALVQAQAQRFTDTATLFQALGGGWWNRPQPLAEVTDPPAGAEPDNRQLQ
jgi:NodT family efflux transporter outer membrane factor (OMF) lipoprotein